MLGVNKKAWAALSPGLQKLIQETFAASALTTYTKALSEDIKAVEVIKKYGVIVEPASKEIEAELIKQAQIFYDGKAAKDAAYAEILKSQRDFQKAYGTAFSRY
jgi:TRAP-type mannitol/chloroaromatic compound transport system substrate-binding protein